MPPKKTPIKGTPKLDFDLYFNYERSKLKLKYPFLPPEQIKSRAQQKWRKLSKDQRSSFFRFNLNQNFIKNRREKSPLEFIEPKSATPLISPSRKRKSGIGGGSSSTSKKCRRNKSLTVNNSNNNKPKPGQVIVRKKKAAALLERPKKPDVYSMTYETPSNTLSCGSPSSESLDPADISSPLFLNPSLSASSPALSGISKLSSFSSLATESGGDVTSQKPQQETEEMNVFIDLFSEVTSSSRGRGQENDIDKENRRVLKSKQDETRDNFHSFFEDKEFFLE